LHSLLSSTSEKEVTKKKHVRYLFAGLTVLLFVACSTSRKALKEVTQLQQDIEIVYDNDVHCAIDGYAKMAFLRDSLKGITPNVLTISAGDFVQGDLAGAVSRGSWIIELMNQVGYDYVVPGNHEFGFGGERLFSLTERLTALTLGCNFVYTKSKQPVFTPYIIHKIGGRDIAFIGVLTMVNQSLNSGKQFIEEDGSYRYSFSPENVSGCVQACIDSARAKGADYIIGISHLGDIPRSDGNSSFNLIAQTHGLDALIDGHAHHAIADTLIKDRNGRDVLFTSSGSRFQNVGRLTLSANGDLHSKLHPTTAISGEDPIVKAMTDSIHQTIENANNEKIGFNEKPLSIKDDDGQWSIRVKETAIGDLITDAFRDITGADIGIMTAGSIREGLKDGDFTHMDIFTILPFFNYLTVSEMKGQDICDMLEKAYYVQSANNKNFMEMSGLSCTVDTTIASICRLLPSGDYDDIPDGPRRVSNVKVLDSAGQWQPIDSAKTYRVAAIEYLTVNRGSRNIMKNSKLTQELTAHQLYAVDCVERYIRERLNGRIGASYAKPQGRIQFKKG